MSIRNTGFVLILTYLMPNVVVGEATNDELMKAIDEIKEGLKIEFVSREEFDSSQEAVRNQSVQMQILSERLDSLASENSDRLAKQEQILSAISHIDSEGTAIPNMSANMANSSEFRAKMSQAVHASVQQEGQFTVVNKMGVEQEVAVNGQQHRLMPGATQTFKVAVGTVTTRLAGQDIDTWTVGAPDYCQSVDIVPRSTSSVEVYRPVYVQPEDNSTYSPTYSSFTTPTYTTYSPLYWYYPSYYFAY